MTDFRTVLPDLVERGVRLRADLRDLYAEAQAKGVDDLLLTKLVELKSMPPEDARWLPTACDVISLLKRT